MIIGLYPERLPNQRTPLAWLPPGLADQLQASQYVYVCTLGALTWDLLMSIGEEFEIFHIPWSLPQIAYIISRLFSFLFVLLSNIFAVLDIDDCQQLLVAIGCMLALAIPANSLLMYIRIRAVYNDSNFIKIIFATLWVGVLCSSVTAPLSPTGEHIGTTRRCIVTRLESIAATGLLISAINDTLIFLTISYYLLTAHHESDNWSDRFKSFIRCKGMYKTPRLLLQTGQLYYAVTAGINVFTVITVMSPRFAQISPAFLRPTFIVPNVALSNAMTCRVFRQLRLGLIDDSHFSDPRNIIFVTPLPASEDGSIDIPDN